MRIYVASSWRNQQQQGVVTALRTAGHEVYDFKNPREGDRGFHWSEIDTAWKSWTPERYREGLEHPVAKAGFRSDMDALEWCEACVLVLPCGRSAHLELGWAAGAGRRTLVLMAQPEEPELMYRMLHRVCVSIEEVVAALAAPAPVAAPRCAECYDDATVVWECSAALGHDGPHQWQRQAPREAAPDTVIGQPTPGSVDGIRIVPAREAAPEACCGYHRDGGYADMPCTGRAPAGRKP